MNGQIQFITQKLVGSDVVETNCGSPIPIVEGTTYAVEIEGYWSTNQTSDTLTINAGTNGATLPVVCSVAPSALWDYDAGGVYLKAGLYRGWPWGNNGTVIERVMNAQLSTTQNAYSSFIQTQPALPTHN